ncbi:uncharacterized protein N7525_009117, partial [Penicillium rubens]|uniref:uncharacterized protein n=1 Tax=Penicillium rubens TaxID=1108849 RepID=UPI002A5A5FA7
MKSLVNRLVRWRKVRACRIGMIPSSMIPSKIILSKHRGVLNKRKILLRNHPSARIAPPGVFPEDQDLPPLPITPPQEQEEEANTSSSQGAQHEPTPNPIEDELERQLQSELLAPSREIVSDIDTGNILSGRRTRRARRDDDFAYATTTI